MADPVMDPSTGNIYTADQAELLELDPSDFVPLYDEEAASLFLTRGREAGRWVARGENGERAIQHQAHLDGLAAVEAELARLAGE